MSEPSETTHGTGLFPGGEPFSTEGENPALTAAERAAIGTEVGTGMGGVGLGSEKITGTSRDPIAASPDVVGAGETGKDKPIVGPEHEEPVVTEDRRSAATQTVVQDATVLAWDQGTRGFATGLVQPVSLSHIPVIPTTKDVRATQLREAPGFPNREVGIPASEFRAVPSAEPLRRSGDRKSSESAPSMTNAPSMTTDTHGSTGIRRGSEGRVDEARADMSESRKLSDSTGSTVGPRPEPVAPGIGVSTSTTTATPPSSLKPTPFQPEATKHQETGLSSSKQSIDAVSTTSVKSGHLPGSESVDFNHPPASQGASALGTEQGAQMGKQGAGMGAAMGTEEMQGVKPIVSEWQGGRAA